MADQPARTAIILPKREKNLQFKEVFRMGSDEQRDGADRQETGDESACFSKLLIRTAIPGVGDGNNEIVDGVRIFDVTSTGPATGEWRSDWLWAREIRAFAGPAGRFFSDGKWLYSASKSGMSRWDPKTGARTGHIDEFNPTQHHLGAGEFAQLSQGAIVRRSIPLES